MIGNVGDLISFASARGVVIDYSEATIALQQASDYLNTFSWVGEPETLVQDDQWPRMYFTSPGGAFFDDTNTLIPIDKGVYIETPVTPRAVVNAAYQIAMAATETELMPTGGQAATTRETVGPITVEYAESTVGEDVSFPWWDSLLGAFLIDDGMSGCNVDVFRG